jgi:hypothetical protein
MGENGAIREDIDIEIWSAVATILKKFFGNDDQVLLETLELETADDRNAGVRFGGSPVEEPREVAITSTVQVIKLVRVFPRLTRLYLEEVLLLGMESDEKESTLENLPIVNFFRTT